MNILKLLIILLFLIPLASAGERYELDFEDIPTKTIEYTLLKRDIAVFNYPVRVYKEPQIVDGKEQIEYEIEEQQEAIMVRDIRITKKEIKVTDLTLFIEGAPTPQYVAAAADDVINVDFEKDLVDDLRIEIIKVDPEQGVFFRFVPIDTSNATPNHQEFKGGKSAPKITGGGESSLSFWDKTKLSISNIPDKTSEIIGLLILDTSPESPWQVRVLAGHWKITIIAVLVLIILAWNQRRIRRLLRRRL